MRRTERSALCPLPVFNRLAAGELKLIGYRLDAGNVDALASFIEANPEQFVVRRLWLHNNCLKED